MIIKKKFDHNILKINDYGIISAKYHQINTTLHLLRDDQKQFLTSKEKL